MIRLDFLDVLQHKVLIVLTENLVRQQFSYLVVNIYKTGLEQPVWCIELCQHIFKYQHQQLIAEYLQFVYQQFFIDGFYYLSCFDCRILVKVLTVVGFHVKSKFSCCVVPNSVFNLYSTIFKNHSNPLTIKILINLKLGKTVACDLGTGAFGHCESQQIIECGNLGHRFYTGIVAWLNPINIFPILFGVVVLNTTQQQVLGYSINGGSHSVYGPQSLVGTVCDHKIFVAQRYLTKILIR